MKALRLHEACTINSDNFKSFIFLALEKNDPLVKGGCSCSRVVVPALWKSLVQCVFGENIQMQYSSKSSICYSLFWRQCMNVSVNAHKALYKHIYLLKSLSFTSYLLITVQSLFSLPISSWALFNSTTHVHWLTISLFLLFLSVLGSSFGLYLPLSPPSPQTGSSSSLLSSTVSVKSPASSSSSSSVQAARRAV